VCVRCLQDDVDQGRAAHIRRAWTHPLAVFCAQHGAPLLPHGHSHIKIADDLTLFGDHEVGADGPTQPLSAPSAAMSSEF
jgi:hypothetical protein